MHCLQSLWNKFKSVLQFLVAGPTKFTANSHSAQFWQIISSQDPPSIYSSWKPSFTHRKLQIVKVANALIKHLCLSHFFFFNYFQFVASSLLVSDCEAVCYSTFTIDLIQHWKLPHKVQSSEHWLSLWNIPTSSPRPLHFSRSVTKHGSLVALNNTCMKCEK